MRSPRLAALPLWLALSALCACPGPVEHPDVDEGFSRAPAQVAALCREPARRFAVLDADGQAVAHNLGACLGRDGAGHHFITQVIPTSSEQPDYELHVWITDEGTMGQAEMRTGKATLLLEWREDGLLVDRMGRTRLIAAPSDAWFVPAHAIYLRELMSRLGVEGQKSVVLESETTAELTLRLAEEQTADDGRVLPPRELESEVITVSLEYPSETGVAGLRYASIRGLDGRELYRQVEATPVQPDALPAVPTLAYEPGEGLLIEPVVVDGEKDEPKLAGELVRKDGEPGRPGAIFLSGAGPQDRYGFVPGTSVDTGAHVIHDALAKAGFVVLRLDERGVGESELGGTATPDFTDQVDDARRAFRFLAARPEVDPSKIVIVGHAEGALAATELAKKAISVGGKKRRPAAVALLAPVGRSYGDAIADEVRRGMEGAPEAEIEAAVAETRRLHDAIRKDEELPAQAEPSRWYMRELLSADPLKSAKAVRAPLGVFYPGASLQVAEQDVAPLRQLVEGRGRKQDTFVQFDGLDHLFKAVVGQSIPADYYDPTRTVDEGFVISLVSWAREVSR